MSVLSLILRLRLEDFYSLSKRLLRVQSNVSLTHEMLALNTDMAVNVKVQGRSFPN